MVHIPVMYDQFLDHISKKKNAIHFDCTFGAGGYAEKILNNDDSCKVIGIDCDIDVNIFADKIKNEYGDRFDFIHDNFSNLDIIARKLNLFGKVDSIIMDLGFSSMQMDNHERGFSFMKNGPLDMRMNRNNSIKSAADLINHASKEKIINILKNYGEERNAESIASTIVETRQKKMFKTTFELADLINGLFDKRGKINPATKTFQAFRIYVNNEIDNLIKSIIAASYVLNNQGRLIIVSFHGLECRVIKHLFRILMKKADNDLKIDWSILQDNYFTLVTKKAIKPSKNEINANIKARSAKMRILAKHTF